MRADQAQSAMIWGIVSLALFFTCLGPFAGLVAIVPLVKARKVLALVQSGHIPPAAAQGAKTGDMCARITIVISVVMAIVQVMMVLFHL